MTDVALGRAGGHCPRVMEREPMTSFESPSSPVWMGLDALGLWGAEWCWERREKEEVKPVLKCVPRPPVRGPGSAHLHTVPFPITPTCSALPSPH